MHSRWWSGPKARALRSPVAERWAARLLEELDEAIRSAKPGELYTSFTNPGFSDVEVAGETVFGMPVREAVNFLDSFFLSYAHGDPPPVEGLSYDEAWERVRGIRRDLQSITNQPKSSGGKLP